MELFRIELSNYKVLSTGADGGHRYISTTIIHQGHERGLTVFFENKRDEDNLAPNTVLVVSGHLMDEGLHQSLLMLDGEIEEPNQVWPTQL